MKDDNILVSVICTCYNHENYIRSALEGFVSQKTDFAYEVIIHDDASTDNSASIIKGYAEKYPDIIKPIFQKENQYSKGINIHAEILWPLAKGKYIAFCEGDDYWIDSNKLQKQVDFLEKNTDFVACVHNSYYEYGNGERHVKYADYEKDIFLEDVIVEGGNAYHTSSLIFRKFLLDERPEWVTSVPGVGDYPLSIYLAISGKIKYFEALMSIYRVATPGSWTMAHRSNPELIMEMQKNILNMLYLVDEYYEHNYTDVLDSKIIQLEYMFLKFESKLKEIKSTRYRQLYLEETMFSKIKMHIKYCAPGIARLKKQISKN